MKKQETRSQTFNQTAWSPTGLAHLWGSHLLGRMLSCLCWKDGDGVTASRAVWFTLAATSWQKNVFTTKLRTWKCLCTLTEQNQSTAVVRVTRYCSENRFREGNWQLPGELWPLRFRWGRSSWRCCWWWRSTVGGSSRDAPLGNIRKSAEQVKEQDFTSSQSLLFSACSVTTLQGHRIRENTQPPHCRAAHRDIQKTPTHFLPSKDVTWKQKRRSSLSTAMTEQLSRSVTRPPATSVRPCCMRLPPCVKKYWRSQEDDTRPVLLPHRQNQCHKALQDGEWDYSLEAASACYDVVDGFQVDSPSTYLRSHAWGHLRSTLLNSPSSSESLIIAHLLVRFITIHRIFEGQGLEKGKKNTFFAL